MNTREKAPTILTREGARRKIARVRDALALADDLLVELYEGRAWEALGHESFEAMCAAELPELRTLKLRAPARKARAVALRGKGATIPEIVAATGASLGAIHRDLNPPKPVPTFQMETAAAPTSLSAGVSNVDRAVAWVAARGAKGLTYIELCERTSWRGGQATGALSEAKRRGLVVPSGEFRDGCSVYVLP